MLSSLEVLQASGISRATLNNYIALGLLPKPIVRNPGDDSRTNARQIGYFPPDAIGCIERIKLLKKEGMTMANIVRQLSQPGYEEQPQQAVETLQSGPTSAKTSGTAATQPVSTTTPGYAIPETGVLRLTIDKMPYPAYMLNYNLELAWYNEQARVSLLGSFEKLPAETKERNVLAFFARGIYGENLVNRETFRQLHVEMGCKRLTGANDNTSFGNTGAVVSPIREWPLNLHSVADESNHYLVFASYFREGILVIFTNAVAGRSGLLGMLER